MKSDNTQVNPVFVTFRLSETTVDGLKDLADKFDVSPDIMLESLIKDRVSVSDIKRNKARRTKARIKYMDSLIIPTEEIRLEIRKAFDKGYGLGWWHFQIRHGNEDFATKL